MNAGPHDGRSFFDDCQKRVSRSNRLPLRSIFDGGHKHDVIQQWHIKERVRDGFQVGKRRLIRQARGVSELLNDSLTDNLRDFLELSILAESNQLPDSKFLIIRCHAGFSVFGTSPTCQAASAV